MSGVLPAIHDRLTTALPGVTIALSRAPDKPDELLLAREYPAGSPRDHDARGRAALELHAVQVLARALTVDAATALAWRAYYALPARHLNTSGGVVDWLIANHTPAHVGYDQNDRALVSTNFTLQRWGNVAPDRTVTAPAGSITAAGRQPSVT